MEENYGFLEGNGIIILLLFFLMIGGGFGNWGNGNSAAVQGAITRADITDAITSQNIESAISNLGNNITQGFGNLTVGMNQGFNGIAAGVANLGYQMQNNCCDIKSTILSEAQATRELIQSNTIQELRDKLSDKDKEILLATLTASQVQQTSELKAYIDASKSSSSSGGGTNA